MSVRTVPQTKRFASRVMLGACALCSVLMVVVLGMVTIYLASIGLGSLSLAFFTQLPSGDVANPGGMRHAIEGTLLLIAGSSVLGIPLGLLAGVYLSEYSAGSWMGGPVRFVADVLGGVPSIVVGILGYELIVVPMGGFSGYAGALALAFIMLPLVARTTEEMLRLVPNSYREGSLALGANKAQTILRVVLPASAGSIVTGIMLAIARVSGETAPLLFTALGSRLMARDFGEPFPALTLQIYTYATGPYQEQKRLAWGGIIVLILILFVLNLAVRAIASRATRALRA